MFRSKSLATVCVVSLTGLMAWLGTVVALGSTWRDRGPEEVVTVEGKVFSGAGSDGVSKPLDQAIVTAYDGNGKVLKRDETKADGKFKLVIPLAKLHPETRAFSVLFEHKDWHAQKVSLLSGKNNYTEFAKILPDKKGPKLFFDIIEQIETYEYLHTIVSGFEDPKENLDKLINAYQGHVKSIPHPMTASQQGPDQAAVIKSMEKEPQKLRLIQDKLSALYKLYRVPDPAVKEIVCPPPTIIYYYPMECYPPMYYGPPCFCRRW
jgi:hypothetical protein